MMKKINLILFFVFSFYFGMYYVHAITTFKDILDNKVSIKDLNKNIRCETIKYLYSNKEPNNNLKILSNK